MIKQVRKILTRILSVFKNKKKSRYDGFFVKVDNPGLKDPFKIFWINTTPQKCKCSNFTTLTEKDEPECLECYRQRCELFYKSQYQMVIQ